MQIICYSINVINVHYSKWILFNLLSIAVTRSLTRALKIMNITISDFMPLRIKKRRATIACKPPQQPRHRTARRLQTIDASVAHQMQNNNRPLPLIWCICRRTSFGKMIFCENKNCQIKWFHIDCLDVRVIPEGDWFCPNCSLLNP